MKTVTCEACDLFSLLSLTATTPRLLHNATEQMFVEVSRQIIMLHDDTGIYFREKRSSFLTICTSVLSDSFLLIALKGAEMTLSPSETPDLISI